MKNHIISSIFKVLLLCIVVLTVSSYFIYHSEFIGLVIFGLGIFCLLSLYLFKIAIKAVWPDIIFGIVDNGLLAILAIFGGEIGGVIGAIIGGVVGNAVTDGIAGIFEGMIAENIRAAKINDNRTLLGSAIGKMSGCLLSAGAVLIIVNFFKTTFYA
ncbi:MAG: hypothetical protein WC750_02195 [Patescibacteria group bacterium]|jgi:hypothetical protein